MFGTTLLVDVPLENRESANHTKKLSTAVSVEAPDLFRIHGVPCIDRGPDKLRPPAVYEHWRSSTSSSQRGDDDRANRRRGDWVQKKTANFARPSSVSADTPNFFKVPGVAINSSSAITGVEAVCSPPPRHQPFSLPETYMHDKDAKPVVGPKTLPGRWRETDPQIGQWGHATREFHQALLKLRHEGRLQGRPKDASTRPASTSRTASVASPNSCVLQPNGTDDAEAAAAAGTSPRQHKRQHSLKGDPGELPTGSPAANAGAAERISVRDAGVRGGKQSKTAVEVFMSRLEGERGPQNRRESIEAFKHMLRDCPTNNSVRFEDNAAVARATAQGGGRPSHADDGKVCGAHLRKVLTRRQEAHRVVSGLMGAAEGSYMLGRGADASKVRLGRTPSPKTPPPVGVVRVSTTRT